jgi:hypothetical protein
MTGEQPWKQQWNENETAYGAYVQRRAELLLAKYQITLRPNCVTTNDPCYFCGARTDPFGYDFMIDNALLCDRCVGIFAPDLFARLERWSPNKLSWMSSELWKWFEKWHEYKGPGFISDDEHRQKESELEEEFDKTTLAHGGSDEWAKPIPIAVNQVSDGRRELEIDF